MKNWYIKTLAFIFSGLAIAACSDMNDLHDKYLAEGETIYLAKFDSIKVYPGRYRMRVDYWITDPKAKICEVKWNMDASTKTVEITPTTGDMPNSFYIDDLDETTISFDFTTYTENMECPSLKTYATTTIYGDRYVSTLLNANVASYSYDPIAGALNLYWSSNYEGVIAYLIRYTDVNGQEIEVRADVNDEKLALLPDFPEFGTLTYAAVYLPVEGAIDEFATEFSEPFATAVEGEKPWVMTANLSLPAEASAWSSWEDVNAYMNTLKYTYTDHPENRPDENLHTGGHVEVVNDAARGKNVLKLTVHAEANEDGTIKCLDDAMDGSADRHSNLLIPMTGDGNHEVCGNFGEQVIYDWYMKIPADFKPINERNHLFYLLPTPDGGERKGNAMIALNAYADNASGTNPRFQIIHNGNTKAGGNNTKRVDNIKMADFFDEWVHITVDIVYSYAGTLKIKMERVSDGKVLCDYTGKNLELWRENAVDMRAYFGIRRWFKTSISGDKFPTTGIETETVYLDGIRIFEKNQNNDNPQPVAP